MARTDQYIGLTEKAHTFIEQVVKTHTEYKCESILLVERGLCGYPIHGVKYTIPNQHGFTLVLTEEIQVTPWSSGPMYFTAMRMQYYPSEHINGELEQNIHDLGRIFPWQEDPSLSVTGKELDVHLGTYWL